LVRGVRQIATKGWYGDSHGHSLAARGIRGYHKSKMVDPMFFAVKQERTLPFNHISDMVKQNKTFTEMQRMHPGADKEDLRQRAIKAIAIRDADDTLTKLDKNGVDFSQKMAQESSYFKTRARDVLQDGQKRSFLQEEKAEILKKRIGEVA